MLIVNHFNREFDFSFLEIKAFELQSMSGNINELIIRNCKELLIRSRTFHNIAYTEHIRLENIKNLKLESMSFDFVERLPTLKLKLSFFNVSYYTQSKAFIFIHFTYNNTMLSFLGEHR